MAKTRALFVCNECGSDTPRWQGRCPACQGWNTLVEERAPRRHRGGSTSGRAGAGTGAAVVRLADVVEPPLARWSSGLPELDFVLGGGIVPGSVILIGGEPGIGKSTLLLQAAARLAGAGHATLYVTGEESPTQLRLRSNRLLEPAGDVHLLVESDLDSLLERAEEMRPDVLLVDSIQTVFHSDVEGGPGSVGQVRECSARLQRFAKASGIALFLVGHVTKEGGIAGPKTLEHLVDTVLYFEGDRGIEHRILRATKNRFGSIDEIGVFRMTAAGLEAVANPSELFLADRGAGRSGSAVTAALEGTRPLLVEIQALATRAAYGSPQRVSSGYEHKRLALLLAVLEKWGGIPWTQLDVFLNVVGGLRVTEPAADAAVAAALASTFRNVPIPPDTLVLGEIGLGGELRPVSQVDRRLGEAARMGFTTAFVPGRSGVQSPAGPVRIIEVPDVGTLLERVLG
jgi:DNA repair protein RadA/Sms